jgi:membrane-associated phospholipid phosphatase
MTTLVFSVPMLLIQRLFQQLFQLQRRFHLGAQYFSRRLTSIALLQGIGLAIAAITLWGFYEIVEALVVQHSQRIDLQVLLGLRRIPLTQDSPARLTPAELSGLGLWLSKVGDPLPLGITAGSLMTSLVWQRQWIPASMAAIASMGALALNPLVQALFPPPPSPLWQRLAYPGVPVLHAALALVIYGLAGYLLARRWPRGQWAIAGLTLALVGSIGGSRLSLGMHGLTNLFAAYTIAALWLMACLVVLHLWREPTLLSDPLRRPSPPSPKRDRVQH